MAQFRVGIIGCGRPFRTEGSTGFGMSHAHARGYEQSPDADIVALADINADNARAFQAEHGGDSIYQDYREMLAKERLDIVSICTWPELHAPMVIAAAEAGVRAIHCEKPMAPTFGEARRMLQVCEERGVQLSFNHQRRFGAPFRRARDILRSGEIGKLIRMEMSCSNMYDWGTHWFDMMFFYNDEAPAEWVLGQIEPRHGKAIFGVYVESQGISHVKFSNGVHGLMITGFDAGWEAQQRLVGEQGVIEVGHGDVHLRVWSTRHNGWQNIDIEENMHGRDAHARGVLDLVDALKAGREPELSGRRALRATELIFATYESSRRHGRVELPLQIEDSPLAELEQRLAR